MEYYDASDGARARLTWTRVDPNPPLRRRGPGAASTSPTRPFPAGRHWCATTRRSTSTGHRLARPQIQPDWFSVRWTRTLWFDAGRYRFTTTTDDGVRLYLDGQLIVDQWRDQPPTTYTAERDWAPGSIPCA